MRLALLSAFAMLWLAGGVAPMSEVAAQSPEAASKVARPKKDYVPKPGGPAFLSDMTKGFDAKTQYISDYVIRESWHNATMHPGNVRFHPGGVTLTLEKRKDRGKEYRGGEIQQMGFYGYGRFEAVIKPPKGNGIVTAFFTHTFEMFDDPHDEIDIEFLGNKPTQLHLNYFKDAKPAGSIYVDIGFDWSKDYNLYAYEWEPNAIRWYVNDRMVHEVRGQIPPIPVAPGRVMVQLWAPGAASVGWVGKIHLTKPVTAELSCLSHVPMGKTGRQCSDTFKRPTGR